MRATKLKFVKMNSVMGVCKFKKHTHFNSKGTEFTIQ